MYQSANAQRLQLLEHHVTAIYESAKDFRDDERERIICECEAIFDSLRSIDAVSVT